MVAKNLRILAGAALLASVAVASATVSGGSKTQTDRALEFLSRSMQRRFSVNVVAIILQRDPGGEGVYQRVKIERSRDGKVRHTVLQPLRMQGIESVDDGNRMRVFLPDQRIIIDQQSPAKGSGDVELRLNLARQNYTFRVESNHRIAGRPAVCVTATPRYDDMDVRRYFIDAETFYPLRAETINNGSSVPVFETKDVQYPRAIDGRVFQMRSMANVDTLKYNPPSTLTRTAAAKIVGFTPLMPQRLPMGFKVQEMQYNGNTEWKSVAIRLTDGLTRATVYQWKPNGKRVKAVEDSTSIDHNGVRLLLVSDLNPELRLKLLQAFVSQALNQSARSYKLFGMLAAPTAGLPARPELMSTLWTFAELDGLAGLAQYGVTVGLPVYSPLR